MQYFVHMSNDVSKHDEFFRYIMSDKSIAVDYLRSFLPAQIAKHIDFATLAQLPESYISADLVGKVSDIVYSCRIKDTEREARVTLLIEHKSYADKFTPVQVGSYIFSGFQKQLRNEKHLSMIIPIVVYHGRGKWEYRTLSGLFDHLTPAWEKHLPDFDYLYHNLGEISDAEIRTLNNRFLCAALLAMKHIFDWRWLGENAEMLAELAASGSVQLLDGLRIYLLARENENEQNRETMEIEKWSREQILEFFGLDMPEGSMADELLKKGREQGREEGVEQGIEQAREATARVMIRKGYSDAVICDVLELTVDQVARLRA